MASDLIDADKSDENQQHVTIDNTWNHKRLISNIDTQTIHTSNNLKNNSKKHVDF